MTQRFCEVCADPLPLDAIDTMCDSCTSAIHNEVALIEEEESECERPAVAEGPSLSETPAATTVRPEADKSTSENVAASSAARSMDPFAGLDLEISIPTSSTSSVQSTFDQEDTETIDIGPVSAALPEVVEAITEARKVTTECEACGYIQKQLHPYKHPNQKEPLLLCDKCFADEIALVNHQDDPMQGKVIHPDEADRDEILTMDDEDRVLYNDEVLINASTPIEEVEARVSLLERRLHRAKLQLKASKRVLFMRVENMKKEEKDKYYREAAIRLAKKKKRAQGDASGTAPKARKSGAPRRSKAQQFRDAMKANGFSDAWIDEQIKKMGLE